MLIYVSNWFTSAERSRANSLLILGGPMTLLWMSISSGYLVQAVGWRWMFLLEGLPSVVWSFFWWRLSDAHPSEALWLNNQERSQLAEKLNQEQANLTSVSNYRKALSSRPVILLSCQYFFWNMSLFGFVLWLPALLNNSSASGIVQTGWLSAAPYLLTVVAMPVVSWLSDKTHQRKPFVWPLLGISGLAFLGLVYVGMSSFWLSFALLVIAGAAMYAPYGVYWAIVPEILPRNVAGAAMALINSLGSLGAFAGAYVSGCLGIGMRSAGPTFFFMASAMFASAVLILAVSVPSWSAVSPLGACKEM
jgi:MFS family permease